MEMFLFSQCLSLTLIMALQFLSKLAKLLKTARLHEPSRGHSTYLNFDKQQRDSKETFCAFFFLLRETDLSKRHSAFCANSHFNYHKSIIYGRWWKIRQLEINWNYPWRLPDLMGCCRNTNRVWSAEQGLECNCKHEQWTPRAGKRKHLHEEGGRGGGLSLCPSDYNLPRMAQALCLLSFVTWPQCYGFNQKFAMAQCTPTAQFSISALL